MSDKLIRYKERNHDDPFDYELDDVILRRDAMEALENEENLHGAMDSVWDGAFRRTKRAAVRVVAGVPAVADVKPMVRGKWIPSEERMRPDMCSKCGCIYEADRCMGEIMWHFCPNCGADMREANDDKR